MPPDQTLRALQAAAADSADRRAAKTWSTTCTFRRLAAGAWLAGGGLVPGVTA